MEGRPANVEGGGRLRLDVALFAPPPPRRLTGQGAAAGAPQPDAGWRTVEWLTTPTANQLMLVRIGWIASNKDPSASLALRRAPNLRFVLVAPGSAQQVRAPVVLPIETGAVGEGVQRVVRGVQAPRAMLADATKALQAELDQFLAG